MAIRSPLRVARMLTGRARRVALVALVVAVAVSGCGAAGEVVHRTTQLIDGAATSTTVPRPTSAPTPTHLGMCADFSSSVDPSFPRTALRALSDVVRRWPSAASTASAGPASATSSLDVYARVIVDSADSFGPQGEIANGSVPSVPSLVAAPTASAHPQDLDGAMASWLTMQSAVNAMRKAAQGVALSLATLLREFSKPPSDGTDIWGCLSALAETLPTSGRRLLVLVTDLAQYGQPQRMGRLNGVRVLVVHICTRAETCQAQEDQWRVNLTAIGAASVRFVRPELARQEISSFAVGG